MADTVWYVAKQKLLAACHAEIADDQDINRFLSGSADDCQCRISINHNQSMTTISGNLPCEMRQFIAGSRSACLLDFTKFRDGRILWYYYLYHEQLCIVAAGKFSSPLDSLISRSGTISSHHHASYGTTLLVIFHKRHKSFNKNRGVLQNQ